MSNHCESCRHSGNCDKEWRYSQLSYVCEKYVHEQTNEEWLRSCPPQELIRFLMNVAYGGQIRNVQKNTFDEEAEKWSKWLEEKHTE